jgi:hypothetical protein
MVSYFLVANSNIHEISHCNVGAVFAHSFSHLNLIGFHFFLSFIFFPMKTLRGNFQEFPDIHELYPLQTRQI